MEKIDVSKIHEDEPQSTLLYGEELIKEYKYTIIIPTYKRGDKFFRSLYSALNQDYDNYEIVIVDNDSDFNNQYIKEKLKELNPSNVRYYKNNENLGAEGNFNRGLVLALGEYVTWLHDDDWLESNFLTQMNKKVKGSKALYCFHTVNGKIDLSNSKIKNAIKYFLKLFYYLNPIKNKINIWDNFVGNYCIGVLGAIYNRAALQIVGGFNKNYYPGTDYELNMRYIKQNGGYLVNKILTNYGIEDNDSFTIAKTFAKFNFNLRIKMIEDKFVKNTKFNKKIVDFLFYNNVKSVKSSWNCESEMPNKEIKHQNGISRIFLQFFLIIYRVLKFGR